MTAKHRAVTTVCRLVYRRGSDDDLGLDGPVAVAGFRRGVPAARLRDEGTAVRAAGGQPLQLCRR